MDKNKVIDRRIELLRKEKKILRERNRLNKQLQRARDELKGLDNYILVEAENE